MYLAIFLLLNQPGIIIHATGGFQRDVHFLAEPQSITTVEGMTVFIPCSFEGTDAAPSWNIKFKNGTIFTASSSDLPPKHLYNGSGIILQDVDVNLNHTTYVCYVIFADTFEKGRIDFNTLRSTPGTVHVFGRHDDIISLQRIVILNALHRLVLSSNLVLIPCQRGVKHQAIILNTSESPNFNESELPSINLQVDCTDKQGHETSHFFRLDSWPPTHIMNVHEVFGIVVAIMFVCVHMNLTSRAKILFQDVKEWNKAKLASKFKMYEVKRKSSLRQFIEKDCNLPFKKDSVYYEQKELSISPFRQIVVLIDKSWKDNRRCYYIFGIKANMWHILLSIKFQIVNMIVRIFICSIYRYPSNHVHIKVFVQNTSTGTRSLDKGMFCLVYKDGLKDNYNKKNKLLIPPPGLTELTVDKNCDLRTFIETRQKLLYYRGCTFYEFDNETEDIEEGKKVILIDKETNEIIKGDIAVKLIGAPGKDVKKPYFVLNKHRVFVQSKSTGCRHVRSNATLLYEDPKLHLKEVREDRFEEIIVTEDTDLFNFIKVKLNYHFERGISYFEFVCVEEDINDDREVILKNVESGKFFTGEKARLMVGAPAKGIRRPNISGWKVFVQNKSRGARFLQKDSLVLYDKHKAKAAKSPHRSLIDLPYN